MRRRRRWGWALPAAVAGIAAWWAGRRSASHRWEALDGVTVPSSLAAHLDDVAEGLGSGFVVTSGYRSAEDQADAMLDLLASYGDPESAAAVYVDEATAYEVLSLLAAGDRDGAIAILDASPLSAHQTGRAADVSKWRQTSAGEGPPDEDELRAAVEAAGGELVVERHVYHLEW